MVMVSSGLRNLAETEWAILVATAKDNEPRVEETDDFMTLLREVSRSGINVDGTLNTTNNSHAKEEFLVNYALRRPRNEYDRLSGRKASDNFCEIRVLRRKIRSANISRKEYALLEIVLDENEKKNKFVLANYLYNGLVGNTFGKMPALDNDNDGFVDYDPILREKIARAKELHYAANVELYGEISDETFWSLIDEKIENIGDNIDYYKNRGKYQVPDQNFVEYKDLGEAETEYEELLALVGPRASATYERYQPRRSTVEKFSALIQEFFEPIFRHIPSGQDRFTSEEAARITNEIIDFELRDATEYRAEVAPSRAFAVVEHGKKRIYFPGNTNEAYTREKLTAILAHEFGAHVLRSLAFEEQPVEPFREALPGNTAFDEGLAKILEQVTLGKFDRFAGATSYIAIGLATILHYDFRRVFEIMWRMEKLTGGMSRSRVFDKTQRAFRGTGVLPNNKDLAYYQGTEKVWHYIEKNIDNPHLLENLFLSGKVDLTNPKEEWLAYEMRKGGLKQKFARDWD